MNLKLKNGIAAVIVLGFILLLAIVAAYFMLTSLTDIKMTKRQTDSARAFYIAEAGLARARFDLDQDSNWADGDINGMICGPNGSYYDLPYSSTTLGGGSYSIKLRNISEETGYMDDQIWGRSTGTYNNDSRTIQARLISARYFDDLSGNVTSAVEAEAAVDIHGSVTINGDVKEYVDVDAVDIFDLTLIELEEIARDYFPATYYGDDPEEVPFSNNVATAVTFISSPEDISQVTETGWSGDGILIVDGDFKITGGTFNGIIWVKGTLDIHGNAIINGGIFVESGVDIDTGITGTPTVSYDPDACDNAFNYLVNSLPALTKDWEELTP
jgi:cytoskeletal protein CcmA (bactofilin family)